MVGMVRIVVVQLCGGGWKGVLGVGASMSVVAVVWVCMELRNWHSNVREALKRWEVLIW